MNTTLSTGKLVCTYNSSNQTLNVGSLTDFKIPAPEIWIPHIPTYNFRVAEYVNKEDKITSVGLQYQVVMHNQYGGVESTGPWVSVDRVKIDELGNVIGTNV